MSKIRQSFSWWCVAGQAKDPEQFLRAAKQIGYEAVELIPQDLWDVARQAGLMIATEGVGPIDQGFNRRENHERFDAFVHTKSSPRQQSAESKKQKPKA